MCIYLCIYFFAQHQIPADTWNKVHSVASAGGSSTFPSSRARRGNLGRLLALEAPWEDELPEPASFPIRNAISISFILSSLSLSTFWWGMPPLHLNVSPATASKRSSVCNPQRFCFSMRAVLYLIPHAAREAEVPKQVKSLVPFWKDLKGIETVWARTG